MTDYRLIENRLPYFEALYKMNLRNGVMPGLVYLYMPTLAKLYNWDAEQKLWFAFLNGMTQNPITSLRMFNQLPEVPPAGATLNKFSDWFNAEWATLQFDTDRRYGKKETVQAIKSYAIAIAECGNQEKLFSVDNFSFLWGFVSGKFHSFGRLTTFSYLEYVKIMGFGADCNNLLFEDKSGSKSHRNGALILNGMDNLVHDKRMPNGFNGEYDNFDKMCEWLSDDARTKMGAFKNLNPDVPNVGYFTWESNLCTFKNHFFGRRYPGVYADMAQDRIVWADNVGQQKTTAVFKEMRAGLLPEWLRSECGTDNLTIKQKASCFPKTGTPYRAEYFL
jgi:hypothetical protein